MDRIMSALSLLNIQHDLHCDVPLSISKYCKRAVLVLSLPLKPTIRGVLAITLKVYVRLNFRKICAVHFQTTVIELFL